MTVGPVGIVGLGAMGLPLARALGEAGPVLGYDAAAAARSAAAAAGLVVAADPADLGACATVVLSLPSAAASAALVDALAAPGVLLLDTSTIGPADARRLADRAAAGGAAYLDTPILGRPDRVGRWTLPAGGPADLVDRAVAVLAPVGSVVRVGEVGAGATLKVVNNLMFSVINAVTAEALLLAGAAGLDPGVFVDTVTGSGAATVSGLFRSVAPRAVDGDFAPVFSLDLVRKDNALAVELAAASGLDLAVGAAALAVHERAVAAGYGAEDSIAVLRQLEDDAGVTARRG